MDHYKVYLYPQSMGVSSHGYEDYPYPCHCLRTGAVRVVDALRVEHGDAPLSDSLVLVSISTFLCILCLLHHWRLPISTRFEYQCDCLLVRGTSSESVDGMRGRTTKTSAAPGLPFSRHGSGSGSACNGRPQVFLDEQYLSKVLAASSVQHHNSSIISPGPLPTERDSGLQEKWRLKSVATSNCCESWPSAPTAHSAFAGYSSRPNGGRSRPAEFANGPQHPRDGVSEGCRRAIPVERTVLPVTLLTNNVPCRAQTQTISHAYGEATKTSSVRAGISLA